MGGKSARTIFIHVEVAWLSVGGKSVKFFQWFQNYDSLAFLADN